MYGDERQHVGGIFLIAKTPRNERFVDDWLRLCEDAQLVTDRPSISPNHAEFDENRHDQAIYSLLILKHASRRSRSAAFLARYLTRFLPTPSSPLSPRAGDEPRAGGPHVSALARARYSRGAEARLRKGDVDVHGLILPTRSPTRSLALSPARSPAAMAAPRRLARAHKNALTSASSSEPGSGSARPRTRRQSAWRVAGSE